MNYKETNRLYRRNDMEEEKLVRAIKWSVLYIVLYGALTVIGNYWFSDEFIAICE